MLQMTPNTPKPWRDQLLAHKATPYALAFVFVLILHIDRLVLGVPYGDDAKFAIVTARQFADALSFSDWLPRWLPEGNFGRGSPQFFYYPPVTFEIAGWLMKLSGGVISLPVALGLTVIGAAYGAMIAFQRWLSEFVSRPYAWVGAALLVSSVYLYAIDQQTRMALAESIAFLWVALGLLAIERAKRLDAQTFLLGAASIAGLILTHMPTTVLFLPVAGVYALLRHGRDVRALAFLAAAIILGMGVSAFYLVPASTLQGALSSEALWSRERVVEHLLFTGALFDLATTVFAIGHFLVAVFIGLVAIDVGVRFLAERPSALHMDERARLALAALFCVILMSPLAWALWRYAPVFYKVQFPWRILSVFTFFLTAYLVVLWRRTVWRFGTRQLNFGGLSVPGRAATHAVFASIAAGLFLASMATKIYSAEEYFPGALEAEIRAEYGGPAEYVSATMPESATLGFGQVKVPFDLAVANTGFQGDWSIERHGARRLAIQLASDRPQTLVLPIMPFDGWRVRGDAAPLLVDKDTGMFALQTPAGSLEAIVELPLTNQERIGAIVSWLSLIGLGAAAFGLSRHASLHAEQA